jgi:hypothetical protein
MAQAKRKKGNPGELLIFGNPRARRAKGNPKKRHARKNSSSHEWEVAKAKQRQAIADRTAGRLTDDQWKQLQEEFRRSARAAGKNPSGAWAIYVRSKSDPLSAWALRETQSTKKDADDLAAYMRKTGSYDEVQVRQIGAGYPKKRRNAGIANHKPGCKCFACKHARQNPREKKLVHVVMGHKFKGATEKEAGKRAMKHFNLRGGRAAKKTFGKNPWHAAGNFKSYEEAMDRRRQLQQAGHSVRMSVSARETSAENYSVYTRKPVSNPAARDKGLPESRKAARRRAAIKRQLRSEGKQPRGDESLKELRQQRRNPDETKQAVKLYEKFHGRDPKEIAEKHVSAAMRLDYTALGNLDYLKVKTPLGQTVKFDFEGDGVKLASSPDGRQLYCIGGNQNIEQCIDADSLQKDFIDMGDALEVAYLARKIHSNYEPVQWFHKFGEETGSVPRLMYDKLRKQIFFSGGDYYIDTKPAISPGIKN